MSKSIQPFSFTSAHGLRLAILVLSISVPPLHVSKSHALVSLNLAQADDGGDGGGGDSGGDSSGDGEADHSGGSGDGSSNASGSTSESSGESTAASDNSSAAASGAQATDDMSQAGSEAASQDSTGTSGAYAGGQGQVASGSGATAGSEAASEDSTGTPGAYAGDQGDYATGQAMDGITDGIAAAQQDPNCDSCAQVADMTNLEAARMFGRMYGAPTNLSTSVAEWSGPDGTIHTVGIGPGDAGRTYSGAMPK